MDFVIVLDDDPVYQNQISKAINEINPSYKIKSFISLEEFYNWLKTGLSKPGYVLNPDPADKSGEFVHLLIVKSEFIGPKNMILLEKVREMFVRRKIVPADKPMGIVLTAFEDPDFDLDSFKSPYLLNLIFKPFDRVILIQHLGAAISGLKKPDETTLSNQKFKATVEVLKSIQVESISEIGFKSISDKAFEVGAFAKYYSKLFTAGDSKSVYGRLHSIVKKPDDSFELNYRYFGLNSPQIGMIKKLIKTQMRGSATELTADTNTPRIDSPTFVIIEPREDLALDFSNLLKRRFRNSNSVRYANLAELTEQLNYASLNTKSLSSDVISMEMDKELNVKNVVPKDVSLWGQKLEGLNLTPYLSKNDKQTLGIWLLGPEKVLMLLSLNGNRYSALKFVKNNLKLGIESPGPMEVIAFLKTKRRVPNTMTAMLVHAGDLNPNRIKEWEDFRTLLKAETGQSPPALVISSKDLSDSDKGKIIVHAHDLMTSPVDRVYFLQRILFDFPGLRILEDPVTVQQKPNSEKIFAASPVEIQEISEAGLCYDGPTAVALGSYREFILYRSQEEELPILAGICYDSKNVGTDEKPEFKNYFVFFGVRDHELKFLRLWIREAYIQSKNKG